MDECIAFTVRRCYGFALDLADVYRMMKQIPVKVMFDLMESAVFTPLPAKYFLYSEPFLHPLFNGDIAAHFTPPFRVESSV